MTDLFSERCGDLLTGSYDCPDRIVLNAYFSFGHSPGGFRVWWRRWHDDGDERLDNAHLMRLAGRFARRLRASAQAHGIPVIDCKAGERKHRIAEEYLAEHPEVGVGVFLILVNRSPALVWKVDRSAKGVICHLEKTRQFVNHYSFHIIDPTWGHVTIKISGHPPFGAQVILNGHEYVACAARSAGIGYTKEGNCFTQTGDPERLAQIADTLSQPGGIGRLGQVIDRWIYSACLCYGLNLDEQQQSGFRYDYSIYQVEYSRNLVFASGAVMDRLFNTIVDRTRSRLDIPTVRTLFGSKGRPHRKPGQELSPRQAVVIEKPRWNLTIFKVHFGHLTLKAYTKGERVLRFEAIAHHTKQLGCGRRLDKFPQITARLTGMVDRFGSMLDCVELGFLPDGILDQLPAPSQLAATRVGGIDLNTPRVQAALAATLALAVAPAGFTVTEFTTKVRAMTGQTPQDYSIRQGAYDLRKLRGKQLVIKPGRTRRYHVPELAARTITALLTLRDKVIGPLIAGIRTPRQGRPPKTWTTIDRDYETLRREMQTLLNHLGIATKATATSTRNCRSRLATLVPDDPTTEPAALLEALADEIADRVTTRLAARLNELVDAHSREGELWTAGRVAAHYDVAVRFVYQHADALGCIRLGGGLRPRLRFDPATVAERWHHVGDALPNVAPARCRTAPRPERQRRGSRPAVELLDFDQQA